MAKATRRDLRRAMGVGAMATIGQQDQAIAVLSNALAGCQREIATLAMNHALTASAYRAEIRALSDCYVLHVNGHTTHDERTQTFWGRLRWVCLGR